MILESAPRSMTTLLLSPVVPVSARKPRTRLPGVATAADAATLPARMRIAASEFFMVGVDF
jgi:hypothetical protein